MIFPPLENWDTATETFLDPPGPGRYRWSLVSHMVSVRLSVHTSVRKTKNTLRCMGPGGSLNSQDFFKYIIWNFTHFNTSFDWQPLEWCKHLFFLSLFKFFKPMFSCRKLFLEINLYLFCILQPLLSQGFKLMVMHILLQWTFAFLSSYTMSYEEDIFKYYFLIITLIMN